MNYVPEVWNECDVWEQAFRRCFVDRLVSSDADRWGYTWAKDRRGF